jgi:hypothetical protein
MKINIRIAVEFDRVQPSQVLLGRSSVRPDITGLWHEEQIASIFEAPVFVIMFTGVLISP